MALEVGIAVLAFFLALPRLSELGATRVAPGRIQTLLNTTAESVREQAGLVEKRQRIMGMERQGPVKIRQGAPVVALDPVPPGDRPGHLVIRSPRVPVIRPGRLLQELPQRQAPRRDIQRLPRPEPRRPARIHPRERLRRPRHPRTPPPGDRGRVRRHRRRQAQPRQHRRQPRLVSGNLVRRGGQLLGIHGRRRRVLGVLGVVVQVQVAGIPVHGPGREVGRVIHPVRPGSPGIGRNRFLVHGPRSVRSNDLTSKMIRK